MPKQSAPAVQQTNSKDKSQNNRVFDSQKPAQNSQLPVKHATVPASAAKVGVNNLALPLDAAHGQNGSQNTNSHNKKFGKQQKPVY